MHVCAAIVYHKINVPASLRRRPDKVRNAARQRSGSLLLCGVPFYDFTGKYLL